MKNTLLTLIISKKSWLIKLVIALILTSAASGCATSKNEKPPIPAIGFKDVYHPLPNDPEVEKDILNVSAKTFEYIKINETTYVCETARDKEGCYEFFLKLEQ